jgi:hypothetical protein
MEALSQIRDYIRAYVAGSCSVNDLQLALAEYHQAASDAARAGDPRAERLIDQVLTLVSEFGLGHYSPDQLRDLLAALLEPAPSLTAQLYVGQNSVAAGTTGAQGAHSFMGVINLGASWPVLPVTPTTGVHEGRSLQEEPELHQPTQ